MRDKNTEDILTFIENMKELGIPKDLLSTMNSYSPDVAKYLFESLGLDYDKKEEKQNKKEKQKVSRKDKTLSKTIKNLINKLDKEL
mgnify:CR=1 FL=1|jgi:hypothetical protein